MKEYGDKIEFFEQQEARGRETQLGSLPTLDSEATFYWNAFALLYPNDITFTQAQAYCIQVGESDVFAFLGILKATAGAISGD